MPGAPKQITYRKAETIRQKIQHLPAPGGKCITISLGVASYPEAGTTADEVLKAANVALFQAKAAGRNCTVLSSQE